MIGALFFGFGILGGLVGGVGVQVLALVFFCWVALDVGGDWEVGLSERGLCYL